MQTWPTLATNFVALWLWEVRYRGAIWNDKRIKNMIQRACCHCAVGLELYATLLCVVHAGG